MERILPEWMKSVKGKTLMEQKNSKVEQTKKEIHRFSVPQVIFSGKIRYINLVGDCGSICEVLLGRLASVPQLACGFDLEWPVSYESGSAQKTALVQLCPSPQVCYLFHVSEWVKLPKTFVELISHPKVKLVGLNIAGDIWKLGRDFDISVNAIVQDNLVELRTFANKVFGITSSWSLARLVLYVLKKRLDKSSDVRLSDWANHSLTRSQLLYAATDAYVSSKQASLLVFKQLKELEIELKRDASATECLEPGADELRRGTQDSKPGGEPCQRVDDQ